MLIWDSNQSALTFILPLCKQLSKKTKKQNVDGESNNIYLNYLYTMTL